jgi:hypothetical protein
MIKPTMATQMAAIPVFPLGYPLMMIMNKDEGQEEDDLSTRIALSLTRIRGILHLEVD